MTDKTIETPAPVQPKRKKFLTVADVERQVWEMEGIRIVLRLPEYILPALNNNGGYDYVRATNHTATLGDLQRRLERGVFGHPVEFTVVRGDYKVINVTAKRPSSTLLSSIRKTYAS